MAWEQKKHGAPYYTRSRREAGRVVREYIGGGLTGELAAQLDAIDRSTRETAAWDWRALNDRLEQLDTAATIVSTAVQQAAATVLEAAGYHQHARGEWRHRRRGK